jgi:hypothetical protein
MRHRLARFFVLVSAAGLLTAAAVFAVARN